MGCAKYIGRVGALAVALGVGVAVAGTPAVALADETTPPGQTSSPDTDTTAPDTSADTETTDPKDDAPADEQLDADLEETADEEETTDEEPPADEEPPPEEVDESLTPITDHQDDEPDGGPLDLSETQDERSSIFQPAAPPVDHVRAADVTIATFDEFEPSTIDTPADISDAQFVTFAPTDTSTRSSLRSAAPAPVALPQRPTLVSVVSEVVAAVLQPLLSPGNGSPIGLPILTAVLALVRNELDRILVPRRTTSSQQTVAVLHEPSAQVVDPTTQRVLVIAVDGTNLSRVIEDCDCENFDALMAESTTGPSSIVGHTTISNPSWTAILTGVWGERTGVVNNIWNPLVYNRYPTVFNQVEAIDPEIDTYVVGNWNVINAIAASGGTGADENYYVPQIEGDTNWLETDDAVAQATINAIPVEGEAPNLVYAYFVGVDENGHMYGGDSPEYLAAVENMDDNLGAIMDAVEAREAETGEQWTVIVVTDHGHQPQQGFGHGFQSPDETETFTIIRSPGYQAAAMNPDYEIVDTTPTIVALFGGQTRPGSDGVNLITLDGSTTVPADLEAALLAQIATNEAPDLVTQLRLGARTVFATIPYYVEELRAGVIGQLPEILVLPANLLFDGLYIVTNVPAQVVAFATGVWGVRFLPLVPAEIPDFPLPPAPANADVLLRQLTA